MKRRSLLAERPLPPPQPLPAQHSAASLSATSLCCDRWSVSFLTQREVALRTVVTYKWLWCLSRRGEWGLTVTL